MRIVLVASLCSALGCVALAAGHAGEQQPQPPVMTTIGPPPPISTLTQLWEQTPTVVLATVQDTLPPHVERDKEVVRIQVFDVEEVLKDDTGRVNPKGRIRVKQYGGSAVVNGRVFYTTLPVDPLQHRDKALLFLSPVNGNTFEVPFGAKGTYVIADAAADTFAIHPSASRLRDFAGRSVISKAEFLKTLQGIAKGRQ